MAAERRSRKKGVYFKF